MDLQGRNKTPWFYSRQMALSENKVILKTGHPMTVTIELPPDVEAGLLEQARAEGIAVSEYVQNLVRVQIAARMKLIACQCPAYELAPEEWVLKFNAWTQSHAGLNLPLLSDGDISRESIYADRGL